MVLEHLQNDLSHTLEQSVYVLYLSEKYREMQMYTHPHRFYMMVFLMR